MNLARERVLKKLREALKQRLPMPYPKAQDDQGLFLPLEEEDVLVQFAQQLQTQGGHFFYAETWEEAVDQLVSLFLRNKWPQPYCNSGKLLQILDALDFICLSQEDTDNWQAAQIGIHTCEALLARTGSILLSSSRGNGRQISIVPEVQIVFATADQAEQDLSQALQRLQGKYADKLPSMLSVVTGPSRTADIEKTLVLGAHGPKALYVFVVEP